MKKIHLVLLSATLMGAAMLLNQSFAQEKPAPGPTRTAVCDVVAVFKSYDRAKDLTNKLKTRLDEIKAESDDRAKKIEKIKLTLDELKAGSKEYDAQLDKMTQLTIERDAWLTFQDELAKRENLRFTKDMYQEVLAASEKVAKERGFQLVLFREASDQPVRTLDELLQQMARRKVLYSDPSLDITESVLRQLNQDYAAGKKR